MKKSVKLISVILAVVMMLGTLSAICFAACDHTPGEAVKENVIEVTCTTSGSYDEVVYCTACGEVLSVNHVPQLLTGHTDADGDRRCDDCGMKLKTGDESIDGCEICGLTNHFGEPGKGIGIITAKGGIICRIVEFFFMLSDGKRVGEIISTIGNYELPF